MQTYNSAK